MADQRPWILEVGVDAWRVLAGAEDGEPVAGAWNRLGSGDLSGQADNIVQHLQEFGWLGETIVLALAAERVLHATLEIPTPLMYRKEPMLRYHFEEYIPWTAEEFAAGCVPHGGLALVFATRHCDLAPLCKALAEQGVFVAAATPAPLLALQGLAAQHELPAESLILWQAEESVDLWRLEGGRPFAWSLLHPDEADVALGLRAEQLLRGDAPVAVVVAGDGQPLINNRESSTIACSGCDRAALLAAELILNARAEPLADLLTGELAVGARFNPVKRESRRLAVAACLAALLTGGAMWRLSGAYDDAAAEASSGALSVYTELFTDEAQPPVDIVGALKEEQRRLRGTREVDRAVPDRADADETLQSFLAGVPDAMRMRLLEVRVEGEKVYATGEVRSNNDADRWAESVRREGFEVDAPRTQHLTGEGFGLRLNAKVAEPASADRLAKGRKP